MFFLQARGFLPNGRHFLLLPRGKFKLKALSRPGRSKSSMAVSCKMLKKPEKSLRISQSLSSLNGWIEPSATSYKASNNDLMILILLEFKAHLHIVFFLNPGKKSIKKYLNIFKLTIETPGTGIEDKIERPNTSKQHEVWPVCQLGTLSVDLWDIGRGCLDQGMSRRNGLVVVSCSAPKGVRLWTEKKNKTWKIH